MNLNRPKISIIHNRRNKLNNKGEASVELRIYFNKKRTYFNTGIYLKPVHWDEKKSIIKGHYNKHKLNGALQDILTKVQNFALKLEINEEVFSFDKLSFFLTKGDQANNFPDWCMRQLEDNAKIEDGTFKKHKSVIKRIKRFSPDATFRDINHKYMLDFDNFCHKEKTQKGKPIEQVTIHSNFNVLKKYINLAEKLELITKAPKYKVEEGRNEKIALSKEEVKRIKKIKFDQDDGNIEKVRDLFLFSCYTALRFGDVETLTKDHLFWDKKGNIKIIKEMDKVKGKIIKLPLNKMFKGKAQKILEKYYDEKKETVFEMIANQNTNKNLKIIKHIAQINKPLSFNISRHTCLTWIGQKTGNPYLVMLVAGHSDIKTSMKYTEGVVNEKLFDLL